jgi:hypothetical protein
MTLGAQYVTPSNVFRGESDYSKVAWELGLPGLALFVWFIVAAIWFSVRGYRASTGWRRQPAAVGMAIATLVSAWMLITFALDTPVVAETYYIFVGLAVAALASENTPAMGRGYGQGREGAD